MTIVLGLLTRKYVALIADRRLSMSDGSALVDDNRSKTIVWCSRAALGYTGLAEIEAVPTNRWIVKILSGNGSPAETLLAEARLAFSRPWAKRIDRTSRRTAFLTVTWDKDGTSPALFVMSNFHDQNGSVLPKATDDFTIRRELLPRGKKFHFVTLGHVLSAPVEQGLRRQLRHHMNKSASAADVVLTLVRTIRQASANDNAVGQNLLSVVLPHKAAMSKDRFRLVVFGPHTDDAVTSQFWANGSESPTQFGPDYVCASGGVIHTQGGPIESIGQVTIKRSGMGVTVEYPLYFPMLGPANCRRPAIVEAPNGERTGLFIVDSPEKLPKLRGSAPLSFGRINDSDQFNRLLRDLGGTSKDIVFVDSETGKYCAISTQDLAGKRLVTQSDWRLR